MIRPAHTALVLASLVFCSPAFTDAQTATTSNRQVRALVHKAHSRAEFLLLAAYFKERSRLYEELAAEQHHALVKELAHPSAGPKYPTTADRARRLSEYYEAVAESSRRREQDFAQKANSVSEE